MSFDNYYCDLEDDDCFAIIPYYSYETLNRCNIDKFIYIDILVFSKKVIFRKYEMSSSAQYLGHSGAYTKIDFKKDCSYITFTTEDNIFNNHIIIGLYGIDKVKINFTDSPKINNNPTINMIPMYFEYLDRFTKLAAVFDNKFPTENYFEHIGSKNIYDFEGYFIYNPINEDSYKLGHLLRQDCIGWHGKYTVKTYYNSHEQIVSLDSILFANYYDKLYKDPNTHSLGKDCHGRQNLKNVLIYKLYHLCEDLREKHTKKEIHYATLEDKMAEMRIKDTYTEETEQIRIDILEYKEKCEQLELKYNILEIKNTELVKKCDAITMQIENEALKEEVKKLKEYIRNSNI